MVDIAVQLGFKSEDSAKTQKYKCLEKIKALYKAVKNKTVIKMRNELKKIERIENFLLGKLNKAEESGFKQQLEENPAILYDLEIQSLVMERLQVISFKNEIKNAHEHFIENNPSFYKGNLGYFLTITIVLIAAIASFFLFENINTDYIETQAKQTNQLTSIGIMKIEDRNNLMNSSTIIEDSLEKENNNPDSNEYSPQFIERMPSQSFHKKEIFLIQRPLLPEKKIPDSNSVVMHDKKMSFIDSTEKPLSTTHKTLKQDSSMLISEYDSHRKGWKLIYRDGLYGFIDDNGNEIVKPLYESIASFGIYQTHWALVYKDGLCGFIDDDGNEIIKPQYESIASFGIYQTHWALVYKDGLYGFIDDDGNEIIKPQYESIASFGIYQTHWALVYKDGLYGFIDDDGKEILKPQYESITKTTSGTIIGEINSEKEEIEQ